MDEISGDLYSIYSVPWGGYGAFAVGIISDPFPTIEAAQAWVISQMEPLLMDLIDQQSIGAMHVDSAPPSPSPSTSATNEPPRDGVGG